MPESLDGYFAAEALDYLDRLERALRSPDGPEAEVMLRLARGVSGSAQMAGASSVAMISERLEDEFRAVQAGTRNWSDAFRRLVDDTLRDLRQLVNDPARWSASQGEVVQATLRRWDTTLTSAEDSTGVATVEIASLFYDDDGPHVLTRGHAPSGHSAAAMEPVPIESLLLQPQGALREALAMRADVVQRLRSTPGAEEALGPTLQELFELLEVAAGGRAEG